MGTQSNMARPFDSSFTYSDRERWICVYPIYINSKRTYSQGRKIPKSRSVENPTYTEIRDVCAQAGLTIGVENKVHPREMDAKDARFRGRVRVSLFDDDGKPLHEQFPNRKSVLLYLGDMIPKLKTRQTGGAAAAAPQQQSGGGNKKKNKRK